MRPGRSAACPSAPSAIIVNSSSVAPSTSGLSAPTPARSESRVGRVMRSPSIIGPQGSPSSRRARTPAIGLPPSAAVAFSCSSSRRSSGTDANPARVGATPARLASRAEKVRARSADTSASAPDSAHTAWNRCWAAGIPSSVSTAPPPADCPAIVTRDGSPPNAAMFSRTHSSAASQSRTPRLEGAPGMWPKPSKPRRYETETVTTPSRLKARPSYQGLAGDPAV